LVEDRRRQRAEVKRQKELAREAREDARLSEQVRARLEVESFENQLEVLLSVHKADCPPFDWRAVLAEPPPLRPFHARLEELRATWDRTRLGEGHGHPSRSIEAAREADHAAHQESLTSYQERLASWTRLRELARGVLGGDTKCYIDALVELNPFDEMAGLGSSLHFTVHSAAVMEVQINLNGKQAIPTEMKSLTASGKLAVKPIPRSRFHEVYQDYICGCILRAGREVFSLLPVEILIVTAVTEQLDTGTGRSIEQPVFSVVLDRTSMTVLNFDQLDPSDAVDRMQHRGDFKASRKQEAFAPIQPLSFGDISIPMKSIGTLDEAMDELQALRREVRERRNSLNASGMEAGETEIGGEIE
jgi:hypothetical protein